MLFDTGMHQPGSLAHLERALAMCNLSLENVRLLVCTHAHSDHYGQAATIVRAGRLRAVDAPQPRAHAPLGRRPRRRDRTPPGGRSPERRPGGAAAPLRGRARRAGIGDRRDRRARPGAPARRGGRHRPRPVERARDARPRPLARVPVPARAAPVDLRRPPAGTHLAVLRLRLLARSRSASSCTRSTSSRRSTRACACPVTAARSPTCTPTSRATASSSQSGWRRPSPRSARARSRRRSRSCRACTAGAALRRLALAAHRDARHAAATSRPPAARGASPASPSAGPARAPRGPPALTAAPSWPVAGRSHTISGCASTRSSAARRAGVLVRVLPAQDGGRRAQPVRRAGRAAHAGAVVRLGHLRRRRLDQGEDDRDRQADQGRVRARGDGPLHLRRGDRARAARDARRDAGGRDRQRARAARRPAGRAGGLDQDRGRARVLARAGRADRATTTRSRSAPPASRRPTSTPRAPRPISSTSPRRWARAWTS